MKLQAIITVNPPVFNIFFSLYINSVLKAGHIFQNMARQIYEKVSNYKFDQIHSTTPPFEGAVSALAQPLGKDYDVILGHWRANLDFQIK